MKDDSVITVDVGTTWTRIALVGCKGVIRHHERLITPKREFLSLFDEAIALRKNRDCYVHAVIFGVPGPVAYGRNIVVRLPNLPCWDVDAISEAARRMAVMPVLFANDADLAVLGEHRFGAGRNIENLVFVSCGSGVGAGIVLGGRLVVGRYSVGEIGHTIISMESRRTVEQVGSGIALERLREQAANIAAADWGECPTDRESESITQIAVAFSFCVRALALCFMPERIVVGGGCANAHPELLAVARDEVGRIHDLLPLKPKDVVETELGDNASILGGYSFWIQAVSRGIPFSVEES